MTDVVSPEVSRHIWTLDVLRGVAFLMVLLHHCLLLGPSPDKPAVLNLLCMIPGELWCGVDVFFVLSGFLITSVLLKSRTKPRFFSNFYARRCLRLAPVSYFVLLLLAVLSLLLKFSWLTPPENFFLFWIGLANFAVAAATGESSIYAPYWSLAVEEQFYLLWSLAVFFCKGTSLTALALVLIAVSLISRAVALSWGLSPMVAYAMTFCRMDGLLVGALIAMHPRLFQKIGRFWLIAIAAAALFASLLIGYFSHSTLFMNPLMLTWSIPLINLASAALLLLCLRYPEKPSGLAGRFAMLCGRLSFCMYLIHVPIKVAVEQVFPFAQLKSLTHNSVASIVGFPLLILALSLLFAWIVRRLFEQRFLDRQNAFR